MISEFISWRFYDHIHMESESGRWEDTRLLFFKHSMSVHGAHITNMSLESCLPTYQEFFIGRIKWKYIPNDCRTTDSETLAAALAIAQMGVMSLDILSKRYFTETLNEVFRSTSRSSPAVHVRAQEHFGVVFEWHGGKIPRFPGSIRVDLCGHLRRAI